MARVRRVASGPRTFHFFFHFVTVDQRERAFDGAVFLVTLDVRVVKEHLFGFVADHRTRDGARGHLPEDVVPGSAKAVKSEAVVNAGRL